MASWAGVGSLIFLSTLSLRRATLQFGYSWQSTSISIHALLAESDQNAAKGEDKPITFLSTLSLRRATGCRADAPTAGAYFYPRSPCGERHCIAAATFSSITHFYPRSPCGERRPARQQRTSGRHFYPRSPCGERLRCHFSVSSLLNFYPRSPCGERPCIGLASGRYNQISIHALLAESDALAHIRRFPFQYFYPRSPCGERPTVPYNVFSIEKISIHALLAESDSDIVTIKQEAIDFYPRSPCGERRLRRLLEIETASFLSTLSLRRATECARSRTVLYEFLSTLPLRRATFRQNYECFEWIISIHALLAESDHFV